MKGTMRIIGGTLSGRKIEPPESITTRPMMDRVREALFNVLEHRDFGEDIDPLFSEETVVLDAFCGTGALAFEAISRGAGRAVLFDNSSQALKVAAANAAALGIKDKCHIIRADATMPSLRQGFGGQAAKLVFLAPPYRKGLIPLAYRALTQSGWIGRHSIIIAETAKKEVFETLEGCELIVSKTYGDTAVRFMKCGVGKMENG
ncbi:MAG: RsmD family RNA methyltransferase [Alphaproteobacteria bacterium]|nr:RsmD family RNA methyltransferase [Alphaproteobacteria bacterium]MCL2505903.1 RsmD family RNA methyltransferase [Alphaproteobacteria bacterium]